MNIYFLFAPAFLEWPLAIADELQKRIPGSKVGGIATGHRQVAQKVAAARHIAISPLAYLNDVEREWLATPVGSDELARYDEMFGTEQLRRLIISDRDIGWGYVTGGVQATNELMRLVRDPSYIERYCAGILRYYLKTFETFRPDVVFCYAVAGAPAFALSMVCEYLGIPFGRFNHTRIGKHLVIDDSPLDWLGPVRQRYATALSGAAPLDHRLAEARQVLEDFRKAATSPDYLDVHKKRMLRQRSLAALARSGLAAAKNSLRLRLGRIEQPLRKPTPFGHFRHLASVALQARRELYPGLFAEPGERPVEPFAFFPLHVDPEASTMVLAPQHTDQLAVIEALSKSLPLGMRLVVKEHIPMLGQRPRGFYERLARIPGVFLASPHDSGIALVRAAAMTVTITGTAGWEAIALGRPALLIGTPPYTMIGEGFVQCGDLSALTRAVKRTLAVNPASDEHLALYLAAILDVSFPSGTDVIWGKITESTVRENPEFLEAVISRLIAMSKDNQPHTPEAIGSSGQGSHG